jgi:Prolipoprotein diacylglyceryltransferase
MISYFLWNGSPEIFALGPISLRWYGLLFALGFLISQQILYYIYKAEGKPIKDVDTLTIYMVVATILGARLGHVIFYQPELLLENPLGVILPFEFSPFRFTGFQGLASHGGAFGILFALWLYANYSIRFSKDIETKGKEAKKTKSGLFINKRSLPGQSYLQVLDRIVILVALTGCLIRLGNFFNSEIIGKPSDSPLAVVFINRVEESILKNETSPVTSVVVKKDTARIDGPDGNVPINFYLFFKQGVSEPQAVNYLTGDVKYYLANLSEFVDDPYGKDLDYNISLEKDGTYIAKISTMGVARHPAQLYESISCLILFLLLFWYWYKWKSDLPPGRIFGVS